MSNEEIREAIKMQISDPVPNTLSRIFELEMQDFDIIGRDNEGQPISRPLSIMRTIGHYKTKLDAIMHMIEISPLAFKDGKLESPIVSENIVGDYYDVYWIDLDNSVYTNAKTLYILHEIVFD